mmetsp:Transcript_44502/g.70757  ORF Transcript_44502/g.70757 Transcript_44502/m.70757 type:complete len:123 (+) Transcript_44502:65-433(+)
MLSCCVGSEDAEEIKPPLAPSTDGVVPDLMKEKIFTFVVQKSGPSDLLGMDVKHKKGQYLVVSKIFNDGAIKRSNGMVADDQRLKEDDVIMEINGIKGDDNAMVEECKKSMKLELKIRRNLK